jgi:hypothetical protein
MSEAQSFATKLPSDLIQALNAICHTMGLRKKFVIEMALREKLEELMDQADLKDAMENARGFESWETVKRDLKKKRII